jgi:hypothetical protein
MQKAARNDRSFYIPHHHVKVVLYR